MQTKPATMIRNSIKLVLIFFIVGLVYFKFIIRGNNRLSVYHHHGIWLPSNTKIIKFVRYPDFPNLVDDLAETVCIMNKQEYFKLLNKQEYHYLVRIDTSKDMLSMTYIFSDYSKIPDSLVAKFPAEFKCKSYAGDFLGIRADLIDTNTVKVEFTTDWN
jgi:hypothetical protein